MELIKKIVLNNIMFFTSMLSKQAKKNFIVFNFFVFYFFFGCSLSVPEPDENNQTLLIIPVETIQTLKKFIYTVNFTIEDLPHPLEPTIPILSPFLTIKFKSLWTVCF